jgi:tetratricopeptide (TPR) repeat protein
MALCLVRAQQDAEAIERLRAAVSLKPDSLMYRNNLAAILVQAQRSDEAVGVLADAHGAAVGHYNVGYLLNQQGNAAAASAHFVQSLRANPSFEPARQMLNRVLPAVGQGPVDRVAERPARPVISNQSSPVRRLGEPTPTSTPDTRDSGSLHHESTMLRADALAQRAVYSEPVAEDPVSTSVVNEPGIDLAQLPPIRVPTLVADRRANSSLGGYVAPIPLSR